MALRKTAKSHDPSLQKLLQEILDELHTQKLRSTPSVRVSVKPGAGTYPEVIKSTSAAGGATVKQLIVKTERKEYLICRTFQNSPIPVEGDTDIYVAKPRILRNAAGTSSFYGRTVTYTPHASTPGRRAAVRSGTTYQEYTYPPYIVQGTIYAVQVEQEIGLLAYEESDLEVAASEITYVDLNTDARRWLKEMETCVNDANAKQLVDVSETYT